MLASVVALSFALSAPDEADLQYQLIVGLAEKGMHEMVVEEAGSFLSDHRGHSKADLARYRLASALFDLGKSDVARPHFTQLAGERGFAFENEVAFRLGQCELERGAHDPAIASLQRLLDGDPGYLKTPATFLLAEASFRKGDYARAEEGYENVSRAGSEEYGRDAAHGLAWCAYRTGRHDVAVRRVEAFLETWPRDERAGELRFLLAESHLEEGRPRRALGAYEAVPEGPFRDAALRGAGFAAAALDDHEGAARWFGRLLAEHPDSRYAAEAALHRGIHLLRSGDAPRALEALRAPALGQNGGVSPEVMYWRGRAFAAQGDHERALELFDRGLRGATGTDAELEGRLQVARGDALYELGRTDEAARVFENAGSDYALHAAAVANLNDGRPGEAVTLARRLLENDSPYADEARLTLAEGLFAQEMYGQAAEAFQSVAANDEDPTRRARASARQAWCDYLNGDPSAAADRFAAVAREHPESAEVEEAVFMEGRARDEAGEEDGARDAYGRYLHHFGSGTHVDETLLRLARLQPDSDGEALLARLVDRSPEGEWSAQGHFDLAERQSAAERFGSAREHYQVVVERFPDSPLEPAARYGLAWCQFSEGEAERAANTLGPLVDSSEVEPGLRLSALELLVWSQRRAGDGQGARRAFAAFAAGCDDEARRFELAKVVAGVLREEDRVSDAQSLYEELLEQTRDRSVAVGVCIERAYLALDQDRVVEAEAQARAAHRFAPDDAHLAETFFFIGERHFDAGADEEAVACYDLAAAAAEPDVAARALYKAGFARLRAGDPAAAANCFRALVDGHPGSELFGESLFLLGESLYRADRYPEAIAALALAREKVPRHEVAPKVLFRLGVALANQERWQEAADALTELARKHDDFPSATEAELWRGRALARLGQGRGARQAFARVFEGDRGLLAAQARLELGRLHEAEDDLDGALAEYLKVAILYGHTEEVAEGLYRSGRVLERRGDPEPAAARYRELLEEHPNASFAEPARERLAELGGH